LGVGTRVEVEMSCEFFIAIFVKKRTLLRMLTSEGGGAICNNAERTLFP
jgi:hypothetical protein